MAAPVITDFILYTTTALDNTDWASNWNQVVLYTTDGTFDFTIKSITTVGNATVGGDVAVTGDITADNITATGTITGTLSGDGAAITGLVPAGCIQMWGGAAAPTGWLLCQGQSLLRSSYTALFTAISTTFGTVDGTHFTLPDLQGKFALGKSNTEALGTSGGSRTISSSNMPAHVHTIAGKNQVGSSYSSLVGEGGTVTLVTANTSSAGSGTDYLQPYVTVNYIIKT